MTDSIRLPWLDLETTGLYPWEDNAAILEVGACVTDERLKIIDWTETVIRVDEPVQWGLLNPRVTAMHTASGLRNAIDAGRGIPLDSAMYRVHEMFARNDALGAPLCGSTINFDRTWLRYTSEATRNLDSALHYRSIDVSGLKSIFTTWYADEVELPAKRDIHRPMADLRDSITLMRYMMRRVERGVFPIFAPNLFDSEEEA